VRKMATKRYQAHNANAFEWLSARRSKSIHAVVTDPPYGILEYLPEQLKKRRNGNGGIWRLPQSYDGNKRNPMPRFTVLKEADHLRIKAFHDGLAPLLHRVLVPGAHVILASNVLFTHHVTQAFTSAGFELRGEIVRVVKTLRGGDRPKGAHNEYPGVSVTPRGCWEPWLVFRKPPENLIRENLSRWGTGALRRPSIDSPFRDLIYSSPARGEERAISSHPSLKPQDFMRQIVWAALPLGKGTILDPFMGSGSTISACTALGLRSIGLEIDQEYFNRALDAIPRLAELEVSFSPNAV